MRVLLLWLIGVASIVTLPSHRAHAEISRTTFKFDASGIGSTVVAHPTASAKKALAIDVGPVTGSLRLKSTSQSLVAGKYRVILDCRLHSAASDDLSKLAVEFILGDGKNPLVKKRMVWTQFDSTPDRYTPMVIDLTIPHSLTPTFDVQWLQVATGSADKVKPIRKSEPPSDPKLTIGTPKKPLGVGDDLLSEIQNENKVTPLSSIDFPAFLIDGVTFELLSQSQFVDTVWPQFVHIYPGQANPIEVTIRNLEKRAVDIEARLEIRAGLDELVHTASQSVALKPASPTTVNFDWTAGAREFGYEARLTLLSAEKPIHTASEYFSVSFPIWKTALQGGGFLDWYGRERFFPEHVARNRANYMNVEEAFSWQPSSWTNLNPDGDHWWSGQGDAHNSREGLLKWIGLSHEQGIKMITYLWPTASGRDALEWARVNPELVTHGEIGFPSEFIDIEDLRLKQVVETEPRLWRLRSGIWNYVGVNRGMMRTIEKGMDETIRSAKTFGWDGARFDTPPSWSAMGAQDMHAEFAKLKAQDVFKRLVPEYYDKTEGVWDGEAVSVSNARYARYRLHQHDPRFAISFNTSAEADRIGSGGDSKVFNVLCSEGGQIMDEAIRLMTRVPWRDYFARIQRQAEATRKRGGYHCVVAPNQSSSVTRCYAAIATFIGGSHPYLDFGWSFPSPGHYTQFMTRFGEYCWGRDLELTTPEEARFTIERDEALWWRDFLRCRRLADGKTQWVMQVLAAPPAERMTPDKPGTMTPWRRGTVVSRKTDHEPTVWALTAEPTTSATRLTVRKSGDNYVAEIPEHRVWTTIVWTEPTP